MRTGGLRDVQTARLSANTRLCARLSLRDTPGGAPIVLTSLRFALEALNHAVMRLSLIITDPYQYQFAIKIM